jgi:hypothetical protein
MQRFHRKVLGDITLIPILLITIIMILMEPWLAQRTPLEERVLLVLGVAKYLQMVKQSMYSFTPILSNRGWNMVGKPLIRQQKILTGLKS